MESEVLSHIVIASIIFACVLISTLLALLIQALLPKHHLGDDSKDVIKLAMGLVATTVALILGLLTASAKSTFDFATSETQHVAVNIVRLDRALAHYGPETKDVRDQLQRLVASRLHQVWPKDGSLSGKIEEPGSTPKAESIDKGILGLCPQTDLQRDYRSQALQISRDLLASRWTLLTMQSNPFPVQFLVVLAFLVCILFASFGLFSPRNGTVAVCLIICALVICGLILLILEMNSPFKGLIKVSSAPLQYALHQLGR